jgi:hypothetical protein
MIASGLLVFDTRAWLLVVGGLAEALDVDPSCVGQMDQASAAG